jgi:hypothetical protein
MFHAGTLELSIPMVQSVRDAVVLSVSGHELRQVLPGVAVLLPHRSDSYRRDTYVGHVAAD